MIFTSEDFESYPIITNSDFTIEEVKDIFYEFIAFITYTNNFILDSDLDNSVNTKNKYTLYDAIYIKQFSYDEIYEMYSTRDIAILVHGAEYNSLLYSAKSIFITNITTFKSFNFLKEAYIIKNILEMEDIKVDKIIEYYKLYNNCPMTLK